MKHLDFSGFLYHWKWLSSINTLWSQWWWFFLSKAHVSIALSASCLLREQHKNDQQSSHFYTWGARRQTGPGGLHQFANSRWPGNPGWTSPEKFGSVRVLLPCPEVPWSPTPPSRMVVQGCPSSPTQKQPGGWQGPGLCVQQCLCLYKEDHFPRMEALDQMIASTYFLFLFQVFHDTPAWHCPVPILPYFQLLISTSSSQFPVTSCFIQSQPPLPSLVSSLSLSQSPRPVSTPPSELPPPLILIFKHKILGENPVINSHQGWNCIFLPSLFPGTNEPEQHPQGGRNLFQQLQQ